jgi:putative membrane protein
MILKKNFSPAKVWEYIKGQMWFVMAWSVTVWAIFYFSGQSNMALSFTPVGVLGSALAIFVAFRNNSAYSRWWEARTLWGGIVNNSRILARQLIANADNAMATGKAGEAVVATFKREMVYRQIAFAHALRLHLRGQNTFQEFTHLLHPEEFVQIQNRQNLPNYLLLIQGNRIKEAMRQEILGPFDNISMEPTLAGLNNFQGSCERIKHTPLPKQYDFFTRVFVRIFSFLLPLGLLSLFTNDPSLSWVIIPVSLIVAGVFVIMERTGAANEDPFENNVTDIPMTALCNTIERDLMEMLGESDLPVKLEAVDGYLY